MSDVPNPRAMRTLLVVALCLGALLLTGCGGPGDQSDAGSDVGSSLDGGDGGRSDAGDGGPSDGSAGDSGIPDAGDANDGGSGSGVTTGSFRFVRTDVDNGVLQVELAVDSGQCTIGRPDDRVVLRILPTDRAGPLPFSAAPYSDWVQQPTSTTVVAVNAFSAYRFDADDVGVFPPTPEIASAGNLTLDVPPDYATGRVVGSYDLVIGVDSFSGTFDSAYCRTGAGVDTSTIADRLLTSCSLRFGSVFEPGSDITTYERDAERGTRAAGLSTATATCLFTAFDCCDLAVIATGDAGGAWTALQTCSDDPPPAMVACPF